MSLFELFKSSFTKQPKLINGKDKSMGKTILYILFLSVILCIPLLVQTGKVGMTIRKDMTKITDQMPDFSVKNNALEVDKKNSGFIYQTNYMNFTFDPDGKTTPEQVQDNLDDNIIGIALLKDRAVLTFASDSTAASMLPNDLIEKSYRTIEDDVLTKDYVVEVTQSNRLLLFFLVSAFVGGLLFTIYDLVLTLLIITVSGHFFSKMRRGPFTFSQNFKLVTFSAALPVVISAVIGLFLPIISTNFIVLLFTLFIYMRVTRPYLPTIGNGGEGN